MAASGRERPSAHRFSTCCPNHYLKENHKCCAAISAFDQNLDLQLDALKRAGCEQVFCEQQSATKIRPEFEKAIAYLREGDSLVVWKLDRLGRNVRELVNRSLPVLAALREWLDAALLAVAPKTKLGEALAYLDKYWPRLLRYTERGDLPVDNNAVENSIRPFVKGRSLCTSLRNLDKHWDLSFNIVATRALFARQRGHNRFTVQVVRANLPRRIRHHLLGEQYPVFDKTTDGMTGDTQFLCRLGH
ncbi:transposase, partial [Alcaligenaceae bacterium CGII-47]|nr:transposase [Alcaligenaceae bacterium CGII-47]